MPGEMPAGRIRISMEHFQAMVQDRPDKEKWELIDGLPILKAQPSLVHQRISRSRRAQRCTRNGDDRDQRGDWIDSRAITRAWRLRATTNHRVNRGIRRKHQMVFHLEYRSITRRLDDEITELMSLGVLTPQG